MQILGGDIGGTTTRLQVGYWEAGRLRLGERADYSSQAYADLVPIVQDFLQRRPHCSIDAACFAVAGPVVNQQAKITNLPWQLEVNRLRRQLGFARLLLVNDFEGAAWGLDQLHEQDTLILQGGTPPTQGLLMQALIGAGTGLGQALILKQDGHKSVLATEGGHVDFAPRDDEEVALWHYLRQTFSRVTYETVLSGPGLVRLFSFYRQYRDREPVPELLQAMADADPAKAISEFALAGKDDVAANALNRFIRIYGAQAGNVALATRATGGLFIGGGIAPKIISAFEDGAFMQAFADKAPMDALIKQIPVRLVLNTDLGLLGAMVLAAGPPGQA